MDAPPRNRYGCQGWVRCGNKSFAALGVGQTGEHKIRIYEERGVPKGDAVLTYEDPNAAHKSTAEFTGEWLGKCPLLRSRCPCRVAPLGVCPSTAA